MINIRRALLPIPLLATLFGASTAQALVETITWTGAVDNVWENAGNWSPNVVPNSVDHIADFNMASGTIQFDGSLGSNITVGGLTITDSGTVTTPLTFQDVSPGGVTLTIDNTSTNAGVQIDPSTVELDKFVAKFALIEPRLGLKVDSSQTTINELEIASQISGKTLIYDLTSSGTGFVSSSLTLNQVLTGNNNLAFTARDNDFAMVTLNQGLPEGNTGDVSVDGPNVEVTANQKLFAGTMVVVDGIMRFVPDAQLNANELNLVRGAVQFGGHPNPVTGAINSSSGVISTGGPDVTIPELNAQAGATAIFTPAGSTTTFSAMTTVTGAVVRFFPDKDGEMRWDKYSKLGVLPEVLINNSDFAERLPGGQIAPVSYVPFNAATANDVAYVSGVQNFSGNKAVAAVWFDVNALLLGQMGNSTLETGGIMGNGNNVVSADMLTPTDAPGEGSNVLYLYAFPGTNLTIGAKIADNVDETHVVCSGGGTYDLFGNNDHTGGMSLHDGTVVARNSQALGTGEVNVVSDAFSSPKIKAVNSALANSFRLVLGPGGMTFEAVGNSAVTGQVTVENNSAADVQLHIAVPNADGSLTITTESNWSVGGAGNPVTGEQGNVNVIFFGPGTHIINGNLNDPKMKVTFDAGAYVVNGTLPDTTVTGDSSISGNGQINNLVVDLFDDIELKLEPGSSIGTLTVVNDMLIQNSNFTYEAEIDDTGISDRIAVGGTLDLSTPTDTLDIRFFTGTTLADANYVLATYGSLVGDFGTVMFDGAPIADPTTPGAIAGTHHIVYGPNALLLSNGDPFLLGDFDGDADVDGRDFLIWQRGGSPSPLSASDLADWQANYGAGALTGVEDDPARWSASPVPEPASLRLVILCVAVLGLARGATPSRRQR